MNQASLLQRVEAWLFRGTGEAPTNHGDRFREWGMNLLRVIYIAGYRTQSDRISFLAASLTFITTLSIVPVLAVSFSVAKGLGVADILRKTIETQVSGIQPEVLEYLFQYVENTNASTLGIIGVLFLFYTVTRMLSSMEDAFNRIWNVPEQRPLYRKFSDYISIVMVCPLLFIAATTITASLKSNAYVEFLLGVQFLRSLVALALSLVPYLLIWIAIAVLYQLLPNTRVPVACALPGAIIAGTLWQVVQSLYITFQIGVAKYNAIYGSFASLPLFLIWLNLSWLILLFGAEMSYAFYGFGKVHPRSLRTLDQSCFEPLALKIFLVLAERFRKGRRPLTSREISLRLGIDPALINEVLDHLIRKSLVAQTKDSPPKLQPARDLEAITVGEVMRGMWSGSESATLKNEFADHVDRIVRRVRCLSDEELEHTSIKEVLVAHAAAQGDSQEPEDAQPT